MAKSPNLLAKIGLTIHIHFFIFFKFTIYKQNLSNLRFVFWQISSELYKFHAICP